ncbi:cobalt transporter [Actinoplanes sp. SE50]|uniref:energy-coupling factor transporter transmembrane component T family protein n=1 Tax=unclassified Actinoplanes TaxID=2626549 RepID=UPI00023EBCBB|nr:MULTISPECIES: energy-coupling factor transporter transmembrane component T [unclassified Actinoplanes]AEV82324.1 Putative permease ybaF [Actinoplanes sp. SE50/110]ATO80721.1 cobalt transporter [Actinoplanes sp. SE50]SLL98128.1 cobalt transporter [Actinoplanes sp. SE50/110]
MNLLLEPIADPGAPLARRNPVAKLGAALLFALPMIATLDPVTPAVALGVELIALPFFGVRARVLARRIWPLLLTAFSTLVAMVLFAADRGGELLFSVGRVDVTTGVLASATGLILRIFAVALPGIAVFTTTDPTDLADALVQNAKAPARFAIGALAAFRLLPLLGQEWRMLTLARRARGVETGKNPVAFASTAFALLVGALRRGVRLAVAMDARGFDSGVPRTYARTQRFTAADAVLLVTAVVLSALILAVSVVSGVFRPIIG